MAESLYKTVCAHCLHEIEPLTGCKCARVVPVPGETGMSENAKLTGYPDHETVRMAIAVANAARHGATAEVLGILRDRLATADATVAALTAENERLRSALANLLDVAPPPIAGRNDYAAARDAARAALPSSRETTDG